MSNLDSMSRNESRVYLVLDYEPRPPSGSVSNCMPTVRVPSQTIVFFIVTKPIQYIHTKSKIVKRCLRIWDLYLKNHRCLAEKLSESHGLTVEVRWKKLRFIGSDGYGWKGLRNAEFEMVEMVGKLSGGGRKMTKNSATPRDHALPVGCVARCSAPRLRALGHWRLPFLVVLCVRGGGAWQR